MAKKLTKNFSLWEFKCKDGTTVPKELLQNVQLLAENLQVLRDEIDQPIDLISGYRTPHYNDIVLPSRKIKTAKRSQHKKAKAGDISVRDMTPDEVADKIEELIKQRKMKQGGLGRYRGFTHYDVRGRKSRWDNR